MQAVCVGEVEQAQLLANGRDYCDIVVWTEKNCKTEHVMANKSFIKAVSEKPRNYFLKVVQPEVMGSLISKQLQQCVQQQPVMHLHRPVQSSGSSRELLQSLAISHLMTTVNKSFVFAENHSLRMMRIIRMCGSILGV
ncbi:hypothetical protein ILYODFUR_033848 [Ilyodon furcidens]|uniref:Uncharacterized protein n=1 Tax=Ilyodon furcidens TaxID=33524 RepID=A0ABV0TRR1_9TELE